jgi:hypothetical protein
VEIRANKNLDIHDNNASWFNGGYALDVQGTDNNMNEEWFGICAKGQQMLADFMIFITCGLLCTKRSAQSFAEGASLEYVDNAFSNISLIDAVLRARGDKAALGGGGMEKRLV